MSFALLFISWFSCLAFSCLTPCNRVNNGMRHATCLPSKSIIGLGETLDSTAKIETKKPAAHRKTLKRLEHHPKPITLPFLSTRTIQEFHLLHPSMATIIASSSDIQESGAHCNAIPLAVTAASATYGSTAVRSAVKRAQLM